MVNSANTLPDLNLAAATEPSLTHKQVQKSAGTMSSYHLSNAHAHGHANEQPVKASSPLSGPVNTNSNNNSPTAAQPALPAMLESIARQNNLGVACLKANDSREAGNALKRALEKANAMTFFSASAGRGAPPYALAGAGEVSKNLYIYQRGEYDEGMHTFSQPLPLEDLSHLNMHAVTATILFNLGQLYLRLNEEQEATDAFLQALQLLHMGTPLTVAVTAKKDGSPAQIISFMALYHNLGHLQYRQGHYEDAVRTYSKALEVGRANPAPSSHQLLELAATLNCLGVLCFHLPQADTEQAMALYQESLQLRYAVLGRDAQTKEIATTVRYGGLEGDECMDEYRMCVF